MRNTGAVPNEETLLTDVVRRLVPALTPVRIYPFGSRARGDARPESDFDVLVLVPSPREEIGALTGRAYALFSQIPWSVVPWQSEGASGVLAVRTTPL